MRHFLALTTFAALVAQSGFADDSASAAKTKSPISAAVTYANWEYYSNLVIAPGQSINLDSGIDYSSSEAVAVTARSADSDIANLSMQAYWTLSGANYFNSAEVVNGSTFPYGNVGGAKFNVFGNVFRLTLVNNGAAPMRLVQVTVFTRII